jgi:hypothetical protein
MSLAMSEAFARRLSGCKVIRPVSFVLLTCCRLMLLALIGVGAAAQQADGTSVQLPAVVSAIDVPDIASPPVNTLDATAQLAADPTAAQLDISTVTLLAADQIASFEADPQSIPQDSLTGSTFCGQRAPQGACTNITSATSFAAGPGRSSRISGGDKPDRPGVGDPAPPTTGGPPLVVCDVGGALNTLMKYNPIDKTDKRFTPVHFRYVC